MLAQYNTALVIIDVQGNLAHAMHGKDVLFRNLERMTLAARALKIPILWVEQLPEKLGPTITEIAKPLAKLNPIRKSTFSCVGSDEFMSQLIDSGKIQLMVVGIEAHICVTQSVLQLLEHGYEVHLISDAISSRTPQNKAIGLQRCEKAGAIINSTEMALFELMRDATHKQFKTIQGLIK